MSDRDWELTSNWFLTHNIGYMGIVKTSSTSRRYLGAELPSCIDKDSNRHR